MVDLKIELPDDFFKGEERCGYFVSSEMKKVWAVELDLLLEFNRVCKELNLTYFLDSGTLLGAVRENGFIPWDDDIDVVMLRKDYDILCDQGNRYFSAPYFFQCAKTDVKYFRGHAQLRNSYTTAILKNEGKMVPFNQGIFIDIFVLDGLIDDDDLLKQQIDEMNKISIVLRKISIVYSEKNLKKKKKKIRSFILEKKYGSFKDLYSMYELVAKRYSASSYCDKLMFRKSIKKVKKLKKSWFSKAEYIEFEGFLFPVPNEYDNILRAYFGDSYMVPQQVSTMHGDVVWDVECPYDEVLKKL